MKTNVIDRCGELNKYRDLWLQALENHKGVKHPFLDFDWVSVYAKHFLKDGRLRVIICRKGDDIAILPLHYIYKGYRRLEAIGKGLFDYGDIITTATGFPLLEGFLKENKIDSLNFFNVRGDSALSAALDPFICGSAVNGSYTIAANESIKSPYLDLGFSGWEDYFGGLKRKFRVDLSRRIRNISSLGELEFGYCKSPEEVEEITTIAHAQHIKRRRYLGQGESIFLDRRMKVFFHEINKKLFLSEKLFLFYFKLSGKAIAIAECFSYGNILYHYMPTFDVAYNKYSPGRILNHHIIKFAIDNHFKELDFMAGDEEYKLEWNSSLRAACDVVFLKNGLSGKIASLDSKARFLYAEFKKRLIHSKVKNIKRTILKGIYKARYDL